MLLVACLAVGCVTKPKRPPGNPVVTAAVRAPSPQAQVKDAITLSAEAALQASAAKTRLIDTQASVLAFKDKEYNELKVLSAGLVERNAATSEELHELNTKIVGAELRINNLVDRLTSVAEDLAAERVLREQIATKLTEAHAAVAAKEAEADQLRQQFEDQKMTSAMFESNAQANFEVAQNSLARAARMEGQRNLVIKMLIGVTLGLLASLVVNYLQFRT